MSKKPETDEPVFSKTLKIMLLTNGLVLLSGSMFGPIYGMFVEQIGGNIFDAGLTGSAFALAAAITTFLTGRIADRLKNHAEIVSLGYLIMALGFLLYLTVSSIYSLLVVQVIIGFAEAFYSPSFDVLYSRHVSRKHAGTGWGAWESINYFSIAVGAMIGGAIASIFGFQKLFLFMSALCLVSSAVILFYRNELNKNT